MKVILVNGSPADKSHTFALLEYISKLLQKRGVKVDIWDLRNKQMPAVIPQYHRNPIQTPNKSVREFVKEIGASDAIVLGSPLYHGSYSGVLKNALDNLAKDAFRNKAIGLVSNSGGGRGAGALEHLRSVVRTLYGYTLQTQIATEQDDYSESKKEYSINDEEIKERCKRFVEELIDFTSALKNLN